MKETIIILCGGGPAPGINAVVASVTKVFLKHNFRVIGLHRAYYGLFHEDREMEELSYDFADKIFSKGGSALKMSRYKPINDE